MLFIQLVVLLVVMLAWLWGQKRFSLTDAQGRPVKGRWFRAVDEAGNLAKPVTYRDRYLFDALMTGVFSLSQAALWVLGSGFFSLALTLVFLPYAAWLLWKGLRAPKRQVPA